MYYRDLEAWRKSIELVKAIYLLTANFPKQETYGLTSQIRKAVISVPSNIAEGTARFSDKETLKFIDIALGSVAEVETQLIIAKELEYIKEIDDEMSLLKQVNALIIGLKNYIKNLST